MAVGPLLALLELGDLLLAGLGLLGQDVAGHAPLGQLRRIVHRRVQGGHLLGDLLDLLAGRIEAFAQGLDVRERLCRLAHDLRQLVGQLLALRQLGVERGVADRAERLRQRQRVVGRKAPAGAEIPAAERRRREPLRPQLFQLRLPVHDVRVEVRRRRQKGVDRQLLGGSGGAVIGVAQQIDGRRGRARPLLGRFQGVGGLDLGVLEALGRRRRIVDFLLDQGIYQHPATHDGGHARDDRQEAHEQAAGGRDSRTDPARAGA